MSRRYDVAIIGSGVLGSCMAYWISATCNASLCVIDKEPVQASHASSRNTGVAHLPFYLNPKTKATMAQASLHSYPMWEKLAAGEKIPWKRTGLLELAVKPGQEKTLEKYSKWAIQNGMSEDDVRLLDASQVAEMEKNVKCRAALYSIREASTDYGKLTRRIAHESQKAGVEYLMQRQVKRILPGSKSCRIELEGGGEIECGYVINCAGANSLDIAKMFKCATQYTDMHFRGEYWIADSPHSNMVNTTIYTVAEFPNYPFLDPHWIRKADGSVEVGPNAVPVMGPDVYSGYIGSVDTMLSKMRQMLQGGALKLLTNPEFISLVSKEWHSSISKSAMINRIRSFIPDIRPEFFSNRGTAGIRTPLISPEGGFVPDVVEEYGENSLHIINYNSPGATGAPAYTARMVKTLQDRGVLGSLGGSGGTVWKPGDQY